MKEFLDSTTGRTLIIALIAAGGTVFASPWDNGAVDVLRSAGGAFFGALAPLVVYLKMNSSADKEQPENVEVPPRAVRPPGTPGRDFHDMFSRDAKLDPIPTVDFDQPYHRDPRDGTPHPGNSPGPGCQWCLAVKPVTP